MWGAKGEGEDAAGEGASGSRREDRKHGAEEAAAEVKVKV